VSVLGGVSRRRSSGVIAVSAILLLAACGGGGSSKKGSGTTDTTTDLSATNVTTSAPSGTNGQCFTDPGPQKARVRFVNLYTNAAHPSGDIDVWQGFSGQDPCGKKLATVPFGTSSDYIDVTAGDSTGNWDAVAFPAGAKAEADTIITQSETWTGGEQVTIIFMGADPTSGNGPTAGANQVIFEKSSTGEATSTFAAVPGKAAIGIGAASVQYVAKDGSWRAGVKGQSGCLLAVGDTATTTTNIGGTSVVPYTVTPGSVTLSLYPSDPGTCTGTPDVGPTTFDAAAGSRTLVLVYGSDAKALKMLVLPIAS
jgi:hypothetical protein